MVALVLIVSLAMAGGVIFKKKVYETLPVAVFAVTLGVYCFALLLPLPVSVYICAGIVAAVFAAALIICRKTSAGFWQNCRVAFTPFWPYIVLMCVCALFFFLLSGHRVFFYDDLSYWALYTKNIFTIDKLPYLHENCSVNYKDYTPVMQILQYIALFGKKVFDEPLMFRTNGCLIYVLLLPILSPLVNCEPEGNHTDRESGSTFVVARRIAVVILYVIFPHILTAQFYYRLGVDLFLALTFGYALYYIFIYDRDELFRLICIVCSLSFLALIKTSGIVLCIFAMLFYVIHELCKTKGKQDKRIITTIKTVVIAVFAFGSYFSWQLFLRHSGNNGYLSNRVKAGIKGGGIVFPWYTREVVLNYIRQFFTYPLTRNRIGVTAFMLVLFIVLIAVMAVKTAKKEGRSDFIKPEMICFVSTMTGFILFCIAHLSMYLFVFDEWEAHGLMEFDRYITQYLGGMLFLYFCKLIILSGWPEGIHIASSADAKRRGLFERLDSRRTGPALVLVVSRMVFVILLPYSDMKQYLIHANYDSMYEKYATLSQEATDEWDRSGIPDLALPHDGTQKVTVVADAWDEKMQFIEYNAVPQPINRLVNVPAVDPGLINEFVMDFVDEYVYVCENAPDSYKGDWTETAVLTDDGNPLVGGGLYGVDRSGPDKVLYIITD